MRREYSIAVILCSMIAGSSAIAYEHRASHDERANRISSTVTAAVSEPHQTESTPAQPIQLKSAATLALSAALSGNKITWWVIDGGGRRGTSGTYVLDASIKQTAIGAAASASYKLTQGFWQNWEVSCCVGTTGNVDGSVDGVIDISDVCAMVSFLGASVPLSGCPAENSVTKDGTVDISDLFALIDFLSGARGLPLCP